jgi:hypothetical protein
MRKIIVFDVMCAFSSACSVSNYAYAVRWLACMFNESLTMGCLNSILGEFRVSAKRVDK